MSKAAIAGLKATVVEKIEATQAALTENEEQLDALREREEVLERTLRNLNITRGTLTKMENGEI